MNVTLLAHTPNPELTIASAARLCYSGATIEDVRDIALGTKELVVHFIIENAGVTVGREHGILLLQVGSHGPIMPSGVYYPTTSEKAVFDKMRA